MKLRLIDPERLIPDAHVAADPSVLPTDEETLKTAEEAVWEAFS